MNLVTTAIAALVGAALFEVLRVPAGALIGATVAVSLLSLTNLGSISIAVLPASAQFLSAVGADAAVVATLHTVRVVAVILIAPLVLKLIPGSG